MSKFKKSLVVGFVSSALLIGVSLPALASDAGAFIGGVAASRVMSNMRARTQAEQEQAYYAKQGAQQQAVPQASSSSSQSPEARIKQLDKLAAGGYITPAEYKQKKQAIVDSM